MDFINECLVKNYEERPSMAEISEHPLLTGVPAESTFIKHELVKKLELYSLAFNKSDITVRQDRLKIDRKNPKQTLVKDDLALLDNEINEELILENIISRYSQNKIYTYIGEILLAINPYK